MKVNILSANFAILAKFPTQNYFSCRVRLELIETGEKRRKGLRREYLQSYLDERMWRQWRGGSYRVIMRNFLAIFPLQSPTDNPVL